MKELHKQFNETDFVSSRSQILSDVKDIKEKVQQTEIDRANSIQHHIEINKSLDHMINKADKIESILLELQKKKEETRSQLAEGVKEIKEQTSINEIHQVKSIQHSIEINKGISCLLAKSIKMEELISDIAKKQEEEHKNVFIMIPDYAPPPPPPSTPEKKRKEEVIASRVSKRLSKKPKKSYV